MAKSEAYAVFAVFFGVVFVVESSVPSQGDSAARITKSATSATIGSPEKTGRFLAETETKSIAMPFKAALLALIFLATGANAAGSRMAQADIEQAFRGVTLDGIYYDGSFFSETYFEDGTIRYHDAFGADSGDWSVRDNMFCTFYDGQQGACFFVVREGKNCFTFYEPVKAPDGTMKPRDDWTSRGWNRQEEATCSKAPEAVI
jgi:hypothetical protein